MSDSRIPGAARPDERAGLSDADFRRLSRFIESELGIRMPDTKRVMLESRLQKRIRHFGMSGFGASAPGDVLFRNFGITVESIIAAAKGILS